MATNGNGGTAVERRTPRDLKATLEQRRDEFAAALAGRIDPDAFIRVAYSTINKTPQLREATPASLLMSLLECATLGLTPNSAMGEAYIVPFRNKGTMEAQFLPGYRGLAKLARNSGLVAKVIARVVREGDHFKIRYGTTDEIEHEPKPGSDSKTPITHVYAVVFYKDGTTQFDVMEKWEVDRIRARSKSGNSGPWVTDYVEMSKKTVFRRLAKYLPLSDENFERALEADNRDYDLSAEIVQQASDSLSRARDIDARAAAAAAKVQNGALAPIEDVDYEEISSDDPPANVDTTTGEVLDAKPDEGEQQEKVELSDDPRLRELQLHYEEKLDDHPTLDIAFFEGRLRSEQVVSGPRSKWTKQDYRAALAELARLGASNEG